MSQALRQGSNLDTVRTSGNSSTIQKHPSRYCRIIALIDLLVGAQLLDRSTLNGLSNHYVSVPFAQGKSDVFMLWISTGF